VHTEAPIVIALSGGVDSATAAAMLVEQGRRVIGITMRLYDATGTLASSGRCCGPRDIDDARRVCAHLDIPFYVVDYEAEFAGAVIDDFVDAYLAGQTPNPCARCNQHIKFTPLLQRARALGADVLATGHYARLETDAGGTTQLRRGVDPAKDQSYFLFAMPRDELASVVFPLGALTKDQVRERAAGYGLPNAGKKESQEICFVPDGDYAAFVEREARRTGRSLALAGEIRDRDGTVVGHHDGVHRFTLGQRRGLGAVGGGKPAYVVDLDANTGAVIVGQKNDAGRSEISVGAVQWFIDPPTEPRSSGVQVRYRQQPLPATVIADGDGARVVFEQAIVAAPGQAAVFYEGDLVLGGGWIR
jgi:tRNA-specific 2-thiouridylase